MKFIMRGNVIDLAVVVVIGAAFSDAANPVVNGFINPLVGVFGTKDLAGYSSCREGPCRVDDKGDVVSGVRAMWGSALSAGLTLLITAAVVYLLTVPSMARYLARHVVKRNPAEPSAVKEKLPEADEIVPLRNIRDALVAPRVGN